MPSTDPIDGEWQLVGVFSDIDSEIRCRLDGRVTLVEASGSVDGTGTTAFECDERGEPHEAEDESPVTLGRLADGHFSMGLGFCGFNGFHSEAEIRGVAGCSIPDGAGEDLQVVGSWRAIRPGGTE